MIGARNSSHVRDAATVLSRSHSSHNNLLRLLFGHLFRFSLLLSATSSHSPFLMLSFDLFAMSVTLLHCHVSLNSGLDMMAGARLRVAHFVRLMFGVLTFGVFRFGSTAFFSSPALFAPSLCLRGLSVAL